MTNIHIGDVVILRAKEGYMCAEGLLVEDVSVSNKTSSFEDSLFRIHLQRQYSAYREYADMLEHRSKVNVNDPKMEKYLTALKVTCL